MMTALFRFPAFLLVFSMLTACAAGRVMTETGPTPSVPEPAKNEETLPRVALKPEILYELLVGEIAGQRGQIGVAAATLGKVAQQTRDPRVAERATLASLYAKRYDEALQTRRNCGRNCGRVTPRHEKP